MLLATPLFLFVMLLAGAVVLGRPAPETSAPATEPTSPAASSADPEQPADGNTSPLRTIAVSRRLMCLRARPGATRNLERGACPADLPKSVIVSAQAFGPTLTSNIQGIPNGHGGQCESPIMIT
jgi:hypothetical protein